LPLRNYSEIISNLTFVSPVSLENAYARLQMFSALNTKSARSQRSQLVLSVSSQRALYFSSVLQRIPARHPAKVMLSAQYMACIRLNYFWIQFCSTFHSITNGLQVC